MDALLRRRAMIAVGGSPAPLPYTPVDYIETDGTAYIDTGIEGNAPMSSKLLVTPAAISSGNRYIFGCRKDSGNTRFVFATLNANKKAGFGYANGAYVDSIDIQDSFDNLTPVNIQTRLKKSDQRFYAKQYGESSYTSVTKTISADISTGINIWLFKYNYSVAPDPGIPGLKCHMAKLYNDDVFGTLVWDGVPCYYNGEYGMWDLISNSFFGNAAGSGAFTGPSV